MTKKISNFSKLCFNFAKVFGGENILDRARLFLQIVFTYIYWKLIGKKEFVFRLKFNNKRFIIFVDSAMDYVSFRETFIQQEYNCSYKSNPRVILDLGANVGDTAIFYSLLYPEATIYSVEPNPFLYDKLVKNVADFKNVKTFKCAIGDKDSTVNFSFGDIHFKGSLLELAENNKTIPVDMFTLTTFAKQQNITNVDIMKFDIEGAEDILLKDEFIKRNVVTVVGEIHDGLTSSEIGNIIDSLNLKDKKRKQLFLNRYIIFGHLK